jgi:hypothetical protein
MLFDFGNLKFLGKISKIMDKGSFANESYEIDREDWKIYTVKMNG